LHETSEVEVGVQIIRDGRLAAGGGSSMDVRKDICGFEELGPFQGRFVCKSAKGRPKGMLRMSTDRSDDVKSQEVWLA